MNLRQVLAGGCLQHLWHLHFHRFDLRLQCIEVIALEKLRVLKKSENPKNPNPTGNALSIQTAIICPNSLVQKTLPPSWNIGYSEKSHKKERLEDLGSRPMVSNPTTALLLAMVFCTQ